MNRKRFAETLPKRIDNLLTIDWLIAMHLDEHDSAVHDGLYPDEERELKRIFRKIDGHHGLDVDTVVYRYLPMFHTKLFALSKTALTSAWYAQVSTEIISGDATKWLGDPKPMSEYTERDWSHDPEADADRVMLEAMTNQQNTRIKAEQDYRRYTHGKNIQPTSGDRWLWKAEPPADTSQAYGVTMPSPFDSWERDYDYQYTAKSVPYIVSGNHALWDVVLIAVIEYALGWKLASDQGVETVAQFSPQDVKSNILHYLLLKRAMFAGQEYAMNPLHIDRTVSSYMISEGED